jgi:hypothetical protein
MKIKIISKTLLIILLIALIVVPSTNAINYHNSAVEKDNLVTTDELNDVDIYRICYVESGDVDHDQHTFSRSGLFLGFPPGFGIGRVSIDLKGWRGDTRIKVKNIFGTTIYNYDVHVSVRGFIGCAYPTVSIFGGILKGRAFYALVSPLN